MKFNVTYPTLKFPVSYPTLKFPVRVVAPLTVTYAINPSDLGTAVRVRVVNSLPLNPAESDICFNATEKKLYLGIE